MINNDGAQQQTAGSGRSHDPVHRHHPGTGAVQLSHATRVETSQVTDMTQTTFLPSDLIRNAASLQS